MKTLKKLPILLALFCTILVSACSEVEVTPRGDGDDEDTPIIINPPKTKSISTSTDTVSIG